MKICVITSLYKPYSKGGAERVVEDIVNGLVGKGHKVVVVTTSSLFIQKKIPLYPPLRKGEIKAIRFYPWNLFWFGDIDKKPFWLRLPWHIIDVFNPYSYLKIKKILKEEKPDVVMTHNLKGIGYTVPAAIRACRVKHIHTVHDVQLVEPSGLSYQKNKKAKKQKSTSSRRSLSQRTAAFLELATVTARAGRPKGECGTPLKILYAWITKKFFGSPDIFISPSQWLMDFYIERGFFKNSKKMVMRNPVPAAPPFLTGSFKKRHSEPALAGEARPNDRPVGRESPGARNEHNEKLTSSTSSGQALSDSRTGEGKGEVINLLYIGQIEVHKGILFLANAVKKLISPSFEEGGTCQSRLTGGAGGGYCIHLDIIGTGAKIAKIKELSKNCENIKIHGFIENSQVNKFIVQSDFVVVPSLCAENAPKVICESFSCSMPVIASNIGGIPELVKNGYNGYVFEAGNEESFKKTLQKCIEERDRWNEFRENAFKSIEGWGIDEYVEKLML